MIQAQILYIGKDYGAAVAPQRCTRVDVKEKEMDILEYGIWQLPCIGPE